MKAARFYRVFSNLNQEAFELLETFNLPQKISSALKQLPTDTELTQATFLELIQTNLPQRGRQQQARVLEAAAIAAYHSQSEWPVVWALVCDDAPQFKLLTQQLGLCWVHEGRHYKKLNPLVACHRHVLDKFLQRYWDYYRQLLAYRDAPAPETARRLREEFHQLFSTPTGYWDLDERLKLTHAKETELLLALEHPEVPLHNNPASLGARTMVQRRNISYGTQTAVGTQAWDTFLSLVATTRKLGVSFIAYVRDRISHSGSIERLAEMIRRQAATNPLGWSWLPDLLAPPDY